MKDQPLATSTSVNNCYIYFLFIDNLSLTAVPLYLLPPRLAPAICGGNGLYVSVNCCPRRDFAQKAKSRGGSLVPRPSLLIRCPREVWERAGERTRSSVALQLCPPLQFGPLTYQPIECVFISSNQSVL